MKSSLYFGIKLKKMVFLHKLSKEHPKIKITQNNNNKIKTNKAKFEEQREKNKTKKCFVKFQKEFSISKI